MLNVRTDGSALKYLLSNAEKRKSQAAISRECNFSTEEPSCSNSSDERMIRNDELSVLKVGCIVNNIVSTIEVDESFHLDDFSITDNNDFKPSVDLSDLIRADNFLQDEEDDAVKKDTLIG